MRAGSQTGALLHTCEQAAGYQTGACTSSLRRGMHGRAEPPAHLQLLLQGAQAGSCGCKFLGLGGVAGLQLIALGCKALQSSGGYQAESRQEAGRKQAHSRQKAAAAGIRPWWKGSGV